MPAQTPSPKFAIYSPFLLDGVCASAILARYAKMKNNNYRFGLLTFNNTDQEFEEMANLKGQYIFILDFPPDNVTDLDRKLRLISENNRVVYWNSHHPYTNEALNTLKKHVQIIELSGPDADLAIPEKKICSAEMVANRFMKFDYIATSLREIAHDLEFWIRKDERAAKLADLIASGQIEKKELVDALALGVLWCEKYERIRKEFLDRKIKETAALLKKSVIKEYGGCKFCFAMASSILPTADAGQYVLDNTEAEVSVIIYRDGRLSFRRKQGCALNLREVAKIFNGGGHAYAAGGNLLIGKETPVKAVNNDTFDEIVIHMNKKLSEWAYK